MAGSEPNAVKGHVAILDNITLPDTPAGTATRLYLEAQERADFSGSAEFFTDDIVFNGLVLKVSGREQVSAGVEGFIKQAIDHLKIEAITQVESGDVSRVLALYWFKLKPVAEPQILCDHLTIRHGKIARIDNVFDAGKLPPM